MSSTNFYSGLSPRFTLKHQPHSLTHDGYVQRDGFGVHSQTSSDRSPRTRRLLPATSNAVQDVVDDFDYFCSLSHSPVGSRTSAGDVFAKESNHIGIESSNLLDPTSVRRQRMKGLRSHSMLHPTDYSDAQKTRWSTRAHTQDLSLHSHQNEGRFSRHSSSRSLAQNSWVSNSPARLTVGAEPPPLGTAISQEALDADDPSLVEFKLQVVGSPSVGKTLICHRLAQLNVNSADRGK